MRSLPSFRPSSGCFEVCPPSTTKSRALPSSKPFVWQRHNGARPTHSCSFSTPPNLTVKTGESTGAGGSGRVQPIIGSDSSEPSKVHRRVGASTRREPTGQISYDTRIILLMNRAEEAKWLPRALNFDAFRTVWLKDSMSSGTVSPPAV